MTATATLCMLGRDSGGYPIQTNEIALPFTTLSQSLPLTANTVASLTVPVGPTTRMLALIKYDGSESVWVQNGATPTLTIPVAPETSTKELAPHCRIVTFGDVLQFITAQTGVTVNICYYALPKNDGTGA